MSYTVSYVGRKFGRLKVLRDGPLKKIGVGIKRYSTSICQCECGRTATVLNRKLITGHTKSCGCLKIDISRKVHTIHSGTGTKEHQIWKSMRQRCNNPKNKSYKYYGGRGIRYSKRWDSYENFFEDMGECPPGLTLERINNKTGHYEKSNCVWDTRKIQARNSRKNIIYTVEGKTACLAELCEIFGKPYAITYQRIRTYGWSVERAFA